MTVTVIINDRNTIVRCGQIWWLLSQLNSGGKILVKHTVVTDPDSQVLIWLIDWGRLSIGGEGAGFDLFCNTRSLLNCFWTCHSSCFVAVSTQKYNFDKHWKCIYLVTDSCSTEWQCFVCDV